MTDRDPELDALWRAQSHDEPPPALDDAIRAAAHRAVHAQPVSTTVRARSSWPAWAGFAAAASIGAIAIGVWQLQPRDVDETKVVASDVPPSAAAPRPQAAAPQQAEPGQAAGGRRDEAAPSAPASSPRVADGKSKPAGAPTTNNAIDEAQRRVLSAPGLPPADVDRQALAAATPPATDARQHTEETVAQNAPAPAATDQRRRAAAVVAQTAPGAAPPTANAMQSRGGVAADAANKPSSFPSAGTARPDARPASPGETTSMAASQPNAVAAARAERSPAAPAPNAAAAPRAERSAEAANAGAAAAARAAKTTMAKADSAAKTSVAKADSAAKTTVAKADKQASAKTTGDYITLIRRALAEHRDADARAALAAMRAEFEFADAALPDDLAAWAKRVPRVAR
jgi:hypothetical protein